MGCLKEDLADLQKTGHLPAGFSSSNGILSLYPAKTIRPKCALVLRDYLYSRTASVTADGVQASMTVLADGTGNWSYEIDVIAADHDSFSATVSYGFAFAFSDNTVGHGYILDYSFIGFDNPGFLSLDPSRVDSKVLRFVGIDSWIRQHWPDLFQFSISAYLSVVRGSETESRLPPSSLAADDLGFSEIDQLTGVIVESSGFGGDYSAPRIGNPNANPFGYSIPNPFADSSGKGGSEQGDNETS